VIYCDHTHDTVEGITIASLIREGKIIAFKRQSGWVYIGSDRVRKYDHDGRERMGVNPAYESDMPGVREAYL
jgi:hypothetical protein